MILRRYQTDDFFFSEVARKIDYKFRYEFNRTPKIFILNYRKRNPGCKINPKVIENLSMKKFNAVKVYPRLETLNEVCKMGGFSLFDIINLSDKKDVENLKIEGALDMTGVRIGSLRFVDKDWDEYDRLMGTVIYEKYVYKKFVAR